MACAALSLRISLLTFLFVCVVSFTVAGETQFLDSLEPARLKSPTLQIVHHDFVASSFLQDDNENLFSLLEINDAMSERVLSNRSLPYGFSFCSSEPAEPPENSSKACSGYVLKTESFAYDFVNTGFEGGNPEFTLLLYFRPDPEMNGPFDFRASSDNQAIVEDQDILLDPTDEQYWGTNVTNVTMTVVVQRETGVVRLNVSEAVSGSFIEIEIYVVGLVFTATSIGVLENNVLTVDYADVLDTNQSIILQTNATYNTQDGSSQDISNIETEVISQVNDMLNYSSSCVLVSTTNETNITEPCSVSLTANGDFLELKINKYRTGTFMLAFDWLGNWTINYAASNVVTTHLEVIITGVPPPVYEEITPNIEFDPNGKAIQYIQVLGYNFGDETSSLQFTLQSDVSFFFLEKTFLPRAREVLRFQTKPFGGVSGDDIGFKITSSGVPAVPLYGPFTLRSRPYVTPNENQTVVLADIGYIGVTEFEFAQGMLNASTVELQRIAGLDNNDDVNVFLLSGQTTTTRSSLSNLFGLTGRQSSNVQSNVLYSIIIRAGDQIVVRNAIQAAVTSGELARALGVERTELRNIEIENPFEEIERASTAAVATVVIVSVVASVAASAAAQGAALLTQSLTRQTSEYIDMGSSLVSESTQPNLDITPEENHASNARSCLHTAQFLNAIGTANSSGVTNPLIGVAANMNPFNFRIKPPAGVGPSIDGTVSTTTRNLLNIDNVYDIYQTDITNLFVGQLFWIAIVAGSLLIIHIFLYLIFKNHQKARRIAMSVMPKIEVLFLNVIHMGIFIGAFQVLQDPDISTGYKLTAVIVVLMIGVGYPLGAYFILMTKVRPYMNRAWLHNYFQRYILRGGWNIFDRFHDDAERAKVERSWVDNRTKIVGAQQQNYFYVERRHSRYYGIWFSLSVTKSRYGDFFESYRGQYYGYFLFEAIMVGLEGIIIGAASNVPEFQAGFLLAIECVSFLTLLWLLPYNDMAEQIIQQIVGAINIAIAAVLVVSTRMSEDDPSAVTVSKAMLYMNVAAVCIAGLFAIFRVCEILYHNRFNLQKSITHCCNNDEQFEEDCTLSEHSDETDESNDNEDTLQRVAAVGVKTGEWDDDSLSELQNRYLNEFYYRSSPSNVISDVR